MNINSNTTNVIDREEALRLLFEQDNSKNIAKIQTIDIFDQYGNYTYPTEATLSKPNIAYGALGGYDFELVQ